ncbi:DNA polymerase III gamma/tau subunits-like protein [Thermovirga lienii DSM 17291]|jgi:DNA polymerase-3 subunit delta'|uniref:DNA polymerase III gamma/tau subunits-like protein n=1 Tax=Thermovirga lienii (strain ATCC BAA-1197 / DSM 17291 / Cas60314) TaxID=580340 RepID=G7VAB5_THELD|nr:DNA polymerase III gamma/tau subunits-like protein [Thermovirga lienii]MDN5318166.1 polymerase subunit delta [Thermovirga sp.]AER66815.1 DNA polymerase III gamma/tau subunits-like protein [Thermovirga lienii DSM 17291]KUK43055.1 MAG: DNA polymerase III gamma/tau subunits-like protein [Thermovirga lienii]MDN5367377.1 polymerase subunit delta [Thermovirga sp.]HCD71888.1 hypothetical protein [Thermovirga lienii]
MQKKNLAVNENEEEQNFLQESFSSLVAEIKSNGIDTNFACVLPGSLQRKLAVELGKSLLCESKTGEDNCESCKAWVGESHPDLIIIGSPDKPPGIKECMSLWEEISLFPVAANRRVAFLLGCDKLSLPAANSLLKLTEETPGDGLVALLMEEEKMLPTLKSRLHIFRFKLPLLKSSTDIPKNKDQFLKWLRSTSNMSTGEVALVLSGWVSTLVDEGRFDKAADIEMARVLSEKYNMSKEMLEDLIYMVLWEGYDFELLSGVLW